jgi:RNA polymerase sigma factor (sigma-70 family)
MKKYDADEILGLINENNFKDYLKGIYVYVYPIAKKIKKEYAQKNEIQVEDIVQETVIRFYRYASEGKLKNGENIEGLLFVMAKNLILNHLKKSKIETIELSENFDKITDNQQDESQVEWRATLFRQLLNQLSEACQQLINAYYYQNLSMKEISLNLAYNSEDVAKSKHYKCKQKLVELIEKTPNLKNQMISV